MKKKTSLGIEAKRKLENQSRDFPGSKNRTREDINKEIILKFSQC